MAPGTDRRTYRVIAPELVREGDPFSARIVEVTSYGETPLEAGERVRYRESDLLVKAGGWVEAPPFEGELGNRFAVFGILRGEEPPATARQHIEILPRAAVEPAVRIARATPMIASDRILRLDGESLQNLAAVELISASGERVPLTESGGSVLQRIYAVPEASPGKYRIAASNNAGQPLDVSFICEVAAIQVHVTPAERPGTRGRVLLLADFQTTFAGKAVLSSSPNVSLDTRIVDVKPGERTLAGFTLLEAGNQDVRARLVPEEQLEHAVEIDARVAPAQIEASPAETVVSAAIFVTAKSGETVASRVDAVIAHPRGAVFVSATTDPSGKGLIQAELPGQVPAEAIAVHVYRIPGMRWKDRTPHCELEYEIRPGLPVFLSVVAPPAGTVDVKGPEPVPLAVFATDSDELLQACTCRGAEEVASYRQIQLADPIYYRWTIAAMTGPPGAALLATDVPATLLQAPPLAIGAVFTAVVVVEARDERGNDRPVQAVFSIQIQRLDRCRYRRTVTIQAPSNLFDPPPVITGGRGRCQPAPEQWDPNPAMTATVPAAPVKVITGERLLLNAWASDNDVLTLFCVSENCGATKRDLFLADDTRYHWKAERGGFPDYTGAVVSNGRGTSAIYRAPDDPGPDTVWVRITDSGIQGADQPLLKSIPILVGERKLSYVHPTDIEDPRGCVPYLLPRPLFWFENPAPRDRTEITQGLAYAEQDGTARGVRVKFEIKGRIADITGKIVSVKAEVAGFRHDSVPEPDSQVADPPNPPSVANPLELDVYATYDATEFNETSFRFAEAGVKGHGFHRIRVTVENAAGLSLVRCLDVEVDRSGAGQDAINAKLEEVNPKLAELHERLEQVDADPSEPADEEQLRWIEQEMTRLLDEVEAKEREADDTPAIRVLETELRLTAAEHLALDDNAKFQLHVIDDEETSIGLRVELASSEKQVDVAVKQHQDRHWLSDSPLKHLILPPPPSGADYPNAELSYPKGLWHKPGGLPVHAVYQNKCEDALPLEVTVSGDSIGYCNEDGTPPQPGQVKLKAKGTPRKCRAQGRMIEGKYEWIVGEKPLGAPLPQIVFLSADGSEIEVRAEKAGLYRMRVVYYIREVCRLVHADHVFEVFQPVPDLTGIEFREHTAEATAAGREQLEADFDALHLEVGVLLRAASGHFHPLPGEAGLEWTQTGPGSLEGPPSRTAGGAARCQFRSVKQAPNAPTLKVGIKTLPVDGADRDVSALNVFDQTGIDVTPGAPAEPLRMYGRETPQDTWRRLPDATTDPNNTSVTTKQRVLHGIRTGVASLEFKLEARDRHDNLVENGTPVDWHLDGTGDLELTLASQRTQGGESSAMVVGGLAAAPNEGAPGFGAQLLRITVGESEFWFGNPLLGAKLDLRLTPGTYDAGQPPLLRRESVTNASRVEVTATLNGRPVTDGVISWTITKGSIAGENAPPGSTPGFAKSSLSRLDSQGRAAASISEIYRASDGTPNAIHNRAWGRVMIIATLGQGEKPLPRADAASGSLKARFDDTDLERRVRHIWPATHFLRQGSYGFLNAPMSSPPLYQRSGPDASGTFTYLPNSGAAPESQEADLRLQGGANGEALIDIVEHRQLVEIVHFPFTAPVGSPVASNFSGKRNAAIHPPPIDFDLKSRYGRVGWDFYATSPGEITVLDTFAAETLYWAGEVHSTVIQGLTNFAVEFEYWPGTRVAAHEILSGWGGDDPARGKWTIELNAVGVIQATFFAHACQTLPPINITLTGGRAATTGWNRIRLAVSGSPANGGSVIANLSVNGAAAGRTATGFNWLPGSFQRLVLGLAEGAPYRFRELRVFGEINAVMNMRRADGVVVPQQTLRLDGAGEAVVRVSTSEINMEAEYGRLPRTNAQLGISGDVAQFATVTSGYCSTWAFDTEVIAALSPGAIRILRGSAEFAYGFLFGEGEGLEGFAGDLIAGMVLIGDLRDIVKNLCYLAPGGEDPDWINFTLAVAGLVLDVGEVFSGGADTPVNAFVAVLKVTAKKLRDVNTPAARRVAAVIGELLLSLLKEWRTTLGTGQFVFTAWQFYPVIRDLYEYLQPALANPALLPEYLEPVFAMIENPAGRSRKEFEIIGETLNTWRRSGMRPSRMAALVRKLKDTQRGFDSRTLRRVLRSLHRRWPRDRNLTPKALLGLAEFARMFGSAKTSRLVKTFLDGGNVDDLIRVLHNIETAASWARRKGQLDELRHLTIGLSGPGNARLGAFLELEVFVMFRHRIFDLRPRINDRWGCDFRLDGDVYVECKAWFEFSDELRKKLIRQFIRFAKHWSTQGDFRRPRFRYVFIGVFRREYYGALRQAMGLAKLNGYLPRWWRLGRRSFLWLGRRERPNWSLD